MRPSLFSDENPVAQLVLTIITCLSCLFLSVSLGSLLSYLFYHVPPADLQSELENAQNVPLQKFFQLVQGVGFFMIPPLILGKVFSGSSTGYLKLNNVPSVGRFSLVFLIVLFAIPVVNLIAGLNSMIRLP
ncbi:MAG TPA: hypothetical protein VIH57_06625, partial [Bacteroidales bacterium]